MRPASIINFERLYLGSMAIGVVNTFVSWDRNMELLRAEPATEMFGSTFVYITTGIGILISLLLWYFVARRASIVAKWIFVIFFAIGLVAIIPMLIGGTYPEGVSGILAVVTTIMQAAAVWMLFRPDTKIWFANRGAKVDSDVFS